MTHENKKRVRIRVHTLTTELLDCSANDEQVGEDAIDLFLEPNEIVMQVDAERAMGSSLLRHGSGAVPPKPGTSRWRIRIVTVEETGFTDSTIGITREEAFAALTEGEHIEDAILVSKGGNPIEDAEHDGDLEPGSSDG
jgi:hypothetical protein